MTSDASDGLTPRQRAEDILLGSLGFGEDAKLVALERTAEGYRGSGVFADGESFEFESDEELSELQIWALEQLGSRFLAEKKDIKNYPLYMNL